MLFHNNLFDLDDLEDIFEDWFRFGRKRKKIAKKGFKAAFGCLALLLAGSIFLAICGGLMLFAANRFFQPNGEAMVESGETVNIEPVEDSQIIDQIGETTVESREAIDIEPVEDSQITDQIGGSSIELREAIYIELVEDSRISDQIGDPFQLIESDLNTTINRSTLTPDEMRLDFEGTVFGSGGSAAIFGTAAQVGEEVIFSELYVITQSEDVIDLLIEVGR